MARFYCLILLTILTRYNTLFLFVLLARFFCLFLLSTLARFRSLILLLFVTRLFDLFLLTVLARFCYFVFINTTGSFLLCDFINYNDSL